MAQVPVSAEVLSGDSTDIRKPEDVDAAEIHARIFQPLFDRYVVTADGPRHVASVAGMDPRTRNPVFHYYERDMITELRLSELRQYVRVAIVEHGLPVGVDVFEPGQRVTIDDLVEQYIEEGILDARLRTQAREVLAAHVTASEVDLDPKTTSSFLEIVKGMANNAFKAINQGVHYHSAEIPLQQTKSIPVDEMKILTRLRK